MQISSTRVDTAGRHDDEGHRGSYWAGGCLAEARVEDPRVKFCAPNYSLGALPDKGDLMHDPAMDEELERL